MNSERDFSAAASSSAILDEKVLVATFDGLVTPEYRLFFFFGLFVFFVCLRFWFLPEGCLPVT